MSIAVFLLAGAGLAAQTDGADAGVIPQDVRRPKTGEAPRYPRDLIIGELGRGDAPEGAYEHARRLLTALLGDNRDSPYLAGLEPGEIAALAEQIKAAGARKFRIGGGREESGGGVSFLVRFIGREQGAAGELYLRQEEGAWRCDSLLLEEARAIPERGSPYEYDFTPYERFF